MILSRFRILSRSRYLPRRLQQLHIERHVMGKEFGVAIDIGGGKSPYKKLMRCDRFESIDVEDRTGTGEVTIADVNVSIPLESNTVDLIVCTEVLEHLHTPTVALSEMYRILSPGGILVVTTPMVWQDHEEPNDFYRYTKYGLKFLVEQAGFTDHDIKPSNGYWYTMIALLVSRMRHPLFIPIVFVLNVFARFVELLEQPGRLPLGIHAVMTK